MTSGQVQFWPHEYNWNNFSRRLPKDVLHWISELWAYSGYRKEETRIILWANLVELHVRNTLAKFTNFGQAVSEEMLFEASGWWQKPDGSDHNNSAKASGSGEIKTEARQSYDFSILNCFPHIMQYQPDIIMQFVNCVPDNVNYSIQFQI